MAMMVSWSRETTPPRTGMSLSGRVSKGKRETFGPQSCSASASKTAATASELMSPETFESARPRSGRKATRSSTSPSRPEKTIAIGSAITMWRWSWPTSVSATKDASMKTAAWARFRMSRTPKTSV